MNIITSTQNPSPTSTSTPLRIILLDSPRTCSQLFRRIFEPHPALQQIIHWYTAPSNYGPERLGRLLRHCDAAEQVQLKWQQDPNRGGFTFEDMTKNVLARVEAIEAEGKIAWIKDHCVSVVREEIVVESLRAPGFEVDGSRNPSVMPDEFLNSLTPMILIRHPALVWSSWWKMASYELMGFVVSDEDFVALASMRWTKIMFDYLRSRGKESIVVDAEDVVNDSRALLDKVGQHLGIDPAGLKDQWPDGFDVSNGWSMEDEISRHSAGVLMRTKGVVPGHKRYEDVDLDEEIAKWEKSFGLDAKGSNVAQALRKIVEAELPIYEYLRQRKLQV